MLAIVTLRNALPPTPTGVNADPPQQPSPDDGLGKIVKLVPTEVVGVYVTAMAFANHLQPWFVPLVFAVCIPLVGFVLYVDSRGTSVRPPGWQYVFRILSFIAWALAISQPFPAIPKEIAAVLVLVLPVIGAPLIK
jgi:hypothetical protein